MRLDFAYRMHKISGITEDSCTAGFSDVLCKLKFDGYVCFESCTIETDCDEVLEWEHYSFYLLILCVVLYVLEVLIPLECCCSWASFGYSSVAD